MMRKSISILSVLLSSATLLAGCRAPERDENASNASAQAQATAPKAVSLVNGSGQCDTPTTPFCDSSVALPPDWPGRVFKLAQDYPTSVPADAQPWLAYDPKTQPDQYIRSVLAYFYEGNIRASVEDSFDPALNTKRKWYTAPWQDVGFNGREPAHGLTRERVNLPGELDPNQKKYWNNYAVGFYNAAGASAIGKVWTNHGAPDPKQGIMPEGSVGAKLLFTTATPDEVPYLAGSPEWTVYIYTDVNGFPNPAPARGAVKVRLLQIDIAVKDKRSLTGWVFGTFVYGGGPTPGSTKGSGWTNVSPVGLMWGNDPGYDPDKKGSKIVESWINPKVRMPHIGYQGRLNGPVDNKISSCLSCHSTAQYPNSPGMVPPDGVDVAPWFRNIPSPQPFTPGSVSLDYSLQVAGGIRNFNDHKALAAAPSGSAKQKRLQADFRDPLPPRDGAPTH